MTLNIKHSRQSFSSLATNEIKYDSFVYVYPRVSVLPRLGRGQLSYFRDTICKIFIQHYGDWESAVMVKITTKPGENNDVDADNN